MTTKKLKAYSDAEWQARVDLAAAYRLTAHFGMTALINNHITSRVPGTYDQFLINEFGLGYDEVTASNLVKIDLDGNVLEEGEHRINTGYRHSLRSPRRQARRDLYYAYAYALRHGGLDAGGGPAAAPAGDLPLP